MSGFIACMNPQGRIFRVIAPAGERGCSGVVMPEVGVMFSAVLVDSAVPSFYELLVELEDRGVVCGWRFAFRGSEPGDRAPLLVFAARDEQKILAACVGERADDALTALLAAVTEPGDRELASAIARRAADPAQVLTDARLQVAASQRLMEAPQRLENELIRVAAHDLRNPLLVVSMGCSFLRDQSQHLTDEDRGFLDDCLDMCDYIGRFLDGMRSLAGFSIGSLALTRAPTDVAELVSQVAAGYARASEHVDVAVAVDVDPGLASVIDVDRDKLTWVVHQLLSNATAYCGAGSRIGLRVCACGEDLAIEVDDDGPGMDPSLQRRVFRPFGKPHSDDRSPTDTGAGVGLAICRRVIEAHGGRIELDSELGRGTRVTVILPR